MGVELFWCDDYNVPVLDKEIAARKCSSISIVKVTEPGDVRPAFKRDVEIIREAIVNEFGDEELARILTPNDELILLNKIPGYPDQADEVIVRGRLIGHRFYDIEAGKWRFRPLYEGVSEMLALRRGYWAILDMDRLPQFYDVHRDRVLEGNYPRTKYVHVAISSRDGKYHGVAKVMRGGRLRIVKSWIARGRLPPGRQSSLETFVELNREYLERKAERAIRFIREIAERFKKPIVVSYSGGKDSLVVLDLTARSGLPFCVLFNDTGLEPLETYENIEEVRRFYNVDIIIASAGNAFWNSLPLFGPPARDYRWCCKVVKLASITREMLRRFPNGFISIVGQRGRESLQRARQPKVAPSKWVTKDIVVAPIHDWTALEVWGYITMRGLPYNKAYERGFDRLGCVICPANELAELKAVAEAYPDIYEKFMRFLGEFQRRLELPDEYVRFGLWRWRRALPGDLLHFIKAKNVNVEYPIVVKEMNGIFEFKSRRSIRPDSLDELIHILGNVRRIGELAYEVRREEVKAYVEVLDENTAVVKAESRDLAIEALAVLARSSVCARCGLCSYWCAKGALRIGDRPILDRDRCAHCLICSRVCPSSQYLIYQPLGVKRAIG